MAKNRKFERGRSLEVVPTASPGDTVSSGDPVLYGERPGVALTDGDDTLANDGKATVQFDGVFELEVKGENNGGNSAISAGDILYYDSDEINVDSNDGTRFGYANEDVDSGATATIEVIVGY